VEVVATPVEIRAPFTAALSSTESPGTYVQDHQKALNRRLKKESAGRFDTVFVFYPVGSKPKKATGVTASAPADEHVLAVMDAVQARVFARFEDSEKRG
jgi:hypothetical protein